MKEINKHNIPKEYMIPLQGKMNKGVYNCFDYKCEKPISHRASKYNVIEDIIGFANSNIGKMVVWECKGCGQKYYFHLREFEETTHHDYVKFYHDYKTKGSWID